MKIVFSIDCLVRQRWLRSTLRGLSIAGHEIYVWCGEYGTEYGEFMCEQLHLKRRVNKFISEWKIPSPYDLAFIEQDALVAQVSLRTIPKGTRL